MQKIFLNLKRWYHWMPSTWGFFALSMAFCTGCGAPDPCFDEDPKNVVKQYLTMLEAQNEARAFLCLSDETKTWLEKQAADFNDDNPNRKRTPAQMIRAGHVISSTREYKKFEVDSETPSNATVSIVMQDGTRIPIELIRQKDKRWAIQLPVDDHRPSSDKIQNTDNAIVENSQNFANNPQKTHQTPTVGDSLYPPSSASPHKNETAQND